MNVIAEDAITRFRYVAETMDQIARTLETPQARSYARGQADTFRQCADSLSGELAAEAEAEAETHDPDPVLRPCVLCHRAFNPRDKVAHKVVTGHMPVADGEHYVGDTGGRFA
jgi:hypothetical protein